MSTDDAANQSQPSPAAPTKKARRWPRRLRLTAIWALVAALGLRIVMMLALPVVLGRVAAFYDLNLDYSSSKLTLLGGSAGLWDVKISDRTSGSRLMTAEYLHGDIVPWRLLTGKLHVIRAEADGVDVQIERTADGHIPLLERWLAKTTAKPTTSDTATSSIDFTSPLRIEALRLSKVQAHVRDQAVTPNLDALFTTDIRVSHVGASDGVPTALEIDAWSDLLLDSLRIQATATASGRSLDAKADLFMTGLHTKPLAGYLEPLGLKPVANSIAMKATASIQAHPAPEPSKGVTATCAIDNVSITADEQQFASVSSIRISADEIDPWAAKFGTISVEGGRLAASSRGAGRYPRGRF